MKHTAVAIPARMADMPRDTRGLPIPFIVLRDTDNRPHFTINDQYKVDCAIRFGLCAICGSALGVNKWFVGGPASAFHPHGAYLDSPIHRECGHYALKVCPYLAISGAFKKRVDGKTLKKEKTPGHIVVLVDQTMYPDQPVVFVFSRTRAYTRLSNGYLQPQRPWLEVEYWKNGEKIADALAWQLIEDDPKLPVSIDSLKIGAGLLVTAANDATG